MITYNNHAAGDMIAKELGIVYVPNMDVCIARIEGGELRGGVIYQRFNGVSAVIHVVGAHRYWMNRDLIWVTFHYPFVQLKLKKLIGLVDSTNQPALDFNDRMGFTEEARIKDAVAFGDLLLMSMTKEQCRWLNIRPDGYKLNKNLLNS